MSQPNESKPLISPEALYEELGLEGLIEASDAYYLRLPQPEFQMGKPFSMLKSAPQLLHHLGLVLAGLDLRPTLRVLDFGAGTCWISKAIWQMGCDVVACDVSAEGLRLGRRLFDDYPTPTRGRKKPEFSLFDGRKLDLETSSVDRIVIFDALHHVPNLEEVAAELVRVLRPGGILALSEPLGEHSTTEASQHEMREYQVLEKDLRIDELVGLFCGLGLSEPTFRLSMDPTASITLKEREESLSGELTQRLSDLVSDSLQSSGVFHFRKGERRIDSRDTEGMAYEILSKPEVLSGRAGEAIEVAFEIKNTGSGYWLDHNVDHFGVVNLGVNLVEANGAAVYKELYRFATGKEVAPGETVTVRGTVSFEEAGNYRLQFDLVSEFAFWFRNHGSTAVECVVEVG